MLIKLDEEQTRQVKAILGKFPKLTDSRKATSDADSFVIVNWSQMEIMEKILKNYMAKDVSPLLCHSM